MRIAVLANLQHNAPLSSTRTPTERLNVWEYDSVETIETIVDILAQAGHTATCFEGDMSLVETLPRFRPDLCFNLCEGHYGESRESHVPALLEMMRLPYTGSGVLSLAVTLDKPTTKQLIMPRGVRTPPFQVVDRPDFDLDPTLRFPLFVKPAAEGSSAGVEGNSVVHDRHELRERVSELLDTYQQPVLVERFIRGRELTIAMVGNTGLQRAHLPSPAWAPLPQLGGLIFLPASEVFVQNLPASDCGAYTHNAKVTPQSWVLGRDYQCPAELPVSLRDELMRLSALTFEATGCRDIARVDFRLDADDNDCPYVLEINALPGLAPQWSDMAFQATGAGLSYADLILGIFAQATHRLGMSLAPIAAEAA